MLGGKIVIIGAGEIGQAIFYLLKNKKQAFLCDKAKSRTQCSRPYAEIIPGAKLIFLCVPSTALRPVLSEIEPYINSKTSLVFLSKGVEGGTNHTVDEVCRDVFGRKQRFIVLHGPMLAVEMRNGQGGAAVAATKSRKAFKILQEFVRDDLLLSCSKDVHGVAVAGVLKNIYALALGVADGLSWGENMKAVLASRAIEEMNLLIDLLGGKKRTVYSKAGVPDFLATAFSETSCNHTFGKELAKKGKSKKFAEGVLSLSSVLTVVGKNKNKLIVLSALEEVILKNKKAKIVFEKLRKSL